MSDEEDYYSDDEDVSMSEADLMSDGDDDDYGFDTAAQTFASTRKVADAMAPSYDFFSARLRSCHYCRIHMLSLPSLKSLIDRKK
jgi:hypothetical protein